MSRQNQPQQPVQVPATGTVVNLPSLEPRVASSVSTATTTTPSSSDTGIKTASPTSSQPQLLRQSAVSLTVTQQRRPHFSHQQLQLQQISAHETVHSPFQSNRSGGGDHPPPLIGGNDAALGPSSSVGGVVEGGADLHPAYGPSSSSRQPQQQQQPTQPSRVAAWSQMTSSAAPPPTPSPHHHHFHMHHHHHIAHHHFHQLHSSGNQQPQPQQQLMHQKMAIAPSTNGAGGGTLSQSGSTASTTPPSSPFLPSNSSATSSSHVASAGGAGPTMDQLYANRVGFPQQQWGGGGGGSGHQLQRGGGGARSTPTTAQPHIHPTYNGTPTSSSIPMPSSLPQHFHHHHHHQFIVSVTGGAGLGEGGVPPSVAAPPPPPFPPATSANSNASISPPLPPGQTATTMAAGRHQPPPHFHHFRTASSGSSSMHGGEVVGQSGNISVDGGFDTAPTAPSEYHVMMMMDGHVPHAESGAYQQHQQQQQLPMGYFPFHHHFHHHHMQHQQPPPPSWTAVNTATGSSSMHGPVADGSSGSDGAFSNHHHHHHSNSNNSSRRRSASSQMLEGGDGSSMPQRSPSPASVSTHGLAPLYTPPHQRNGGRGGGNGGAGMTSSSFRGNHRNGGAFASRGGRGGGGLPLSPSLTHAPPPHTGSHSIYRSSPQPAALPFPPAAGGSSGPVSPIPAQSYHHHHHHHNNPSSAPPPNWLSGPEMFFYTLQMPHAELREHVGTAVAAPFVPETYGNIAEFVQMTTPRVLPSHAIPVMLPGGVSGLDVVVNSSHRDINVLPNLLLDSISRFGIPQWPRQCSIPTTTYHHENLPTSSEVPQFYAAAATADESKDAMATPSTPLSLPQPLPAPSLQQSSGVPHHRLPNTEELCAMEPIIPLSRIWDAFHQPYGTKVRFGVPVQLCPYKSADESVHYEPQLSSLYIEWLLPCGLNGTTDPHDESVATATTTDEEGESVMTGAGTGGRSSSRERMSSHNTSSGGFTGSSGSVFQWYASERAENRVPLHDQITWLARTSCPQLMTASTADIGFRSFVSVLWQPIFCLNHTPQRSCGSFLCFYALRPGRHHFVYELLSASVMASSSPLLPNLSMVGNSPSHPAANVAAPPNSSSPTGSLGGGVPDGLQQQQQQQGVMLPQYVKDNVNWWSCPVFRSDAATLKFSYWGSADGASYGTHHGINCGSATAGGGAGSSSAASSSTCQAPSSCQGPIRSEEELPYAVLPLVGMIPLRPRPEAWFLPTDSAARQRTAQQSMNANQQRSSIVPVFHAPLYLVAAAFQLTMGTASLLGNSGPSPPAAAPQHGSSSGHKATAGIGGTVGSSTLVPASDIINAIRHERHMTDFASQYGSVNISSLMGLLTHAPSSST